MPKSKRAKVIHTSKVTKKGKEHKIAAFTNVQDAIQKYPYAYIVDVTNMRNNYLKDVRTALADSSRLFFGKNKLIAKALLSTSTLGLDDLAPHLHGPVGLILSHQSPDLLIPTLSALRNTDFSRAGSTAPRDFILPSGTVHASGGELREEHDVPMAHSMETGLRALGVPSRLVKGRVVLEGEYVICKEGDVLDSRQTRLLKMFGVAWAEFRVGVLAYWSKETGKVTAVEKSGGEAMEE
ncbi:MAG: mRNA turnover 4 [Vezdaea aestivalis]|nr:MAG: mRNA turnover 4 [Vezdaea aestivalis]